MKIRFWGGAGTVTGSKHLLTCDRQRLLLECGLFQGHRDEAEYTNRNFPFKARDVSFVVLSHAHIDHCGNLPNLVKRGFRGTVLMTPVTAALTRILLLDSARIQEADADYLNRKRRKQNEPLREPLYTETDVERSFDYFSAEGYARKHRLGKFTLWLHDAGHILGSALVDIEVDGRRILFTGDLGRPKVPIVRDPVLVSETDYLVMEATYGNRVHGSYADVANRLAELINRVYQRGGRIIIPAFAVERSQEVVYNLRCLREAGSIPAMPVFVDSPLASRVTEVYRNNPQYYDDEALSVLDAGREPLDFPELRYVETVEESKSLNDFTEPCIIISASGMCEAGRVLHHLKHAIGDPRNLVLLVSFQAQHTLGRRLQEGQPVVRIYGEEFERRCEVVTMDEFSAHADRNGLLGYVRQMNLNRLKKVFIVHAEPDAAGAMVEPLRELGVREVIIPSVGDEYEL
ncbi:MAG: MBL fold metallo-hydrolase [candidate division WOR-3 bacterium]